MKGSKSREERERQQEEREGEKKVRAETRERVGGEER